MLPSSKLVDPTNNSKQWLICTISSLLYYIRIAFVCDGKRIIRRIDDVKATSSTPIQLAWFSSPLPNQSKRIRILIWAKTQGSSYCSATHAIIKMIQTISINFASDKHVTCNPKSKLGLPNIFIHIGMGANLLMVSFGREHFFFFYRTFVILVCRIFILKIILR